MSRLKLQRWYSGRFGATCRFAKTPQLIVPVGQFRRLQPRPDISSGSFVDSISVNGPKLLHPEQRFHAERGQVLARSARCANVHHVTSWDNQLCASFPDFWVFVDS
ncbi:hypothetical protein CISG_07561 [Coccidioides immitis RMSCC 3703]|uniref:Uncharacterized protein n=1 Tax=Coccidioides immitis RMSCC 3703 TaxID=454286 RepID=A0A0J8R661_COCIT|nr:hypothetical protein CISG_07561 [Coccidioides immitis RMSCC 3703]